MPAATHAATINFATMFDSIPVVTVTDEQYDSDLAAWQLGRTVRMVTSFDCADASCIDEPAKLHADILDLIPDLQGDENANMRQQCMTLMLICATVAHDRGETL